MRWPATLDRRHVAGRRSSISITSRRWRALGSSQDDWEAVLVGDVRGAVRRHAQAAQGDRGLVLGPPRRPRLASVGKEDISEGEACCGRGDEDHGDEPDALRASPRAALPHFGHRPRERESVTVIPAARAAIQATVWPVGTRAAAGSTRPPSIVTAAPGGVVMNAFRNSFTASSWRPAKTWFASVRLTDDASASERRQVGAVGPRSGIAGERRSELRPHGPLHLVLPTQPPTEGALRTRSTS
jgi:hypothetical protein